jgi:tripartite ATP-independent transporter DctM subunit
MVTSFLVLLAIPFFILIAMGIPVAISLGIPEAVFLIFGQERIPITSMPALMFNGLNNFALNALPLFCLTGVVMNKSGITGRLVKFSKTVIGWAPGSLGHANVVASMLFGGINGSAIADVSSVGSVLIPAMKKERFPAGFSAAVTAASAIAGPIIPPSLPMVVLGAMIGISIGGLFLAGFIPGIVVGVGQMVLIYYISRKKDWAVYPFPKIKEIYNSTFQAFPALTAPIIIIGGIVSGVFTPTEAGAIAAAYSMIIGLFFFRTLTLKDIYESFVETVIVASAALFVLSTAMVVSKILSFYMIPQKTLEFLFTITSNKFLLLFIIFVFLLIVGMFMDAMANMIILAPLIYPIVSEMGMHPLHFGLFFILTLLVGQITPPFALALYIAAPIAETPFDGVVRAVLPFLILEIGLALCILYIPEISLFIPRLFGFV